MDISCWPSNLTYEQWIALPISGARPSARYKHAAAVVDDKLYITGGSCNGRYLSDIQAFDFRSLTWCSLKLKIDPNADKSENNGLQEVLPGTSDHSMIKWKNKLLLLGGHSKKCSKCHDSLFHQSRDTCLWCHGDFRKNSGSSWGSFCDTETMIWSLVETTQTPPAPRFDHSAAVHSGHYLFIFGGCSHSIFFNDLHVLDLQTMEWSQSQIQGDLVSPRAGHAGCLETLALNMSKLAWSTLTTLKERHPLASEGLSVCAAVIDGEKHLVAFGGYNGKCNNEVYVMKLKPRDSSHPKIFRSPAAAAAAASVTAAYALAKSEKLDLPQIVDLNVNGVENYVCEKELNIEIGSIKEEKRALELSIEEVRAENSKLRERIHELNSDHAELSKELQSVQGQLISERSRCFKLEAQIAGLQKMLEPSQFIEKEVQILRRQKSAVEQEMELSNAQRQGSGGAWMWIAGGTQKLNII
ncbi:hypothetical protein PTKIN_Ptkin13bG0203300 [Pterospermum kingtungense]